MTAQARIEKQTRLASVAGRGVLVTRTGAFEGRTSTGSEEEGLTEEGLTSG